VKTNLSPESQQIILQAKKSSICIMKPVIKEELIMLAFIKLQHPLWLVVKHKFGLEEHILSNIISEDIIKNGADDPDKVYNIKKEEEYFELADSESKKEKSSTIEPKHLFKAIFLSNDNSIQRYLETKGIQKHDLLVDLDKISYADFAAILDKNNKYHTPSPIRKTIRAAEQYSHDTDSESSLKRFGRNLNELAKEGKLDPVFFRDEEIQSTIETLCRKKQNNPLLLGEAGVGKTAIAEGIAQLMVAGNIPDIMKGKEIIELSITSLVAGTNLRGQFEENIKRIIDECQQNPNVILFIDEIHMIVGAGGEKGVSDAANMLKPALARGQLRCIGATTTKESRQFLEKDKALKRRFQPVFIKEPTIKQTIGILNKCKDKFESFHKVKINDDAVKAAVEFADKYIKDRHFPGKAIDLIDHACACDRIDPDSDNIITAEKIATIVAKHAQVPTTQLLSGKANELSLLEARLKERVIGQDEVIKDLVEVIHLTKMGMDINPQRPEGVFLFVGPSGVGKTELAKSLTAALLGDESRLVSFDMAEYKEQASTSRLLGAAPGYVGYEQESRFVSTIRSNPNSIILMDEIEKAHPDVLAILKQVFEKGKLSTQDGETVFFSHSTIILTSNIGAEVLKEDELQNLEYTALCKTVKDILEKVVHEKFSQSFLNSIDKMVYFNPINKKCMQKIIDNKIQMIINRLESKGIRLNSDKKIGELLLDKGYSIKFGAKFVDKTIEDHLLKPLTRYMLENNKAEIFAEVAEAGNIIFK
jgi:ATP-dependent Clp protease ATP-binding subunit ClpC